MGLETLALVGAGLAVGMGGASLAGAFNKPKTAAPPPVGPTADETASAQARALELKQRRGRASTLFSALPQSPSGVSGSKSLLGQ